MSQHLQRPHGRSSVHDQVVRLLESGGLPLLLVLLVVFFAVDPTSGSVFLGSANVKNILGNQAVTGIVALAMVVPLVAGYFDLSVSAVAGVSNVAVAATLGTHGWPIWAGLLFGIALGAAIGCVNGFLVARLRLNGFVVTLGSYTLLLGLVQYYTKGQEIVAGIPASFSSWGGSSWFGVPRSFYLLIAVALLAWYLLTHVPYGRYLEAIGSNESAAKLVGIPTERSVFGSFVISGTLAAGAGALEVAVDGSGNPTIATSFLFPALTAVFLGATMIKPGRYNVWGTVIGVYLVAVSVSGFTLLGASDWVQSVFNGGALILAVALSTFMGRARDRRAVIGTAPKEDPGSSARVDERPNASSFVGDHQPAAADH